MPQDLHTPLTTPPLDWRLGVSKRHNRSPNPMASTLPEPGQIVIVRQRPFVVNDIQTSTLPLPSTVQDQSARQHLLRLSSMEDEGLGEELSVIWEDDRPY